MYRSGIDHAKTDAVKLEGTWGLLTHNRRVQFGALCIFVYVGAEVALGSNLMAYLAEPSVMGRGLQAACHLVEVYWQGAERQRVAEGKGGSVRVNLGGASIIKYKDRQQHTERL